MTMNQVKWLVITIVCVAVVGVLVLFGLKIMKYTMAFVGGMIAGAAIYHAVVKKFNK